MMKTQSIWFSVLLVALVAGCSGDDGNKEQRPRNNDNNEADVRNNFMWPDVSDASLDAATDMRTPDMDMSAPDIFVLDMRRDMPPEDMGMTMLPSGICGNFVVEPGETCDDCSDLSCDDLNACTLDRIAGDASMCSAFCSNEPIAFCAGGDGCCPAGCTAATDADCSTTCGDGVVDALETCDGDCPTACDDMDPTTDDVLTGSAANCNVECVFHVITRCISGDGTCPMGCIEATDSDCEPECGNGVIETGETCDPPESCPSCDDGNPCTDDNVAGSAATCDVVCSRTVIETCTDNDGCCGERCSATQDNDCSATCGNGTVENPPETCEGPQGCNAVQCNPNACEVAVRTGHHQSCNIECGYLDVRSCTPGDGCCPLGCTSLTDSDCEPTCGNGLVEAGEICDPPSLCDVDCPAPDNACATAELIGDPSTCDAQCVIVPVTTCEADGCCPSNCSANDDPDCVPFCGNGFVEQNEICDGNCPSCDDMDACTTDTRLGLAANCDVTCQNEPITVCGNADGCCPSTTTCDANQDQDCTPICGNGVLEIFETCDGNCPAGCGDGDVCTTDVMMGSSATCDVVCTNPVITACGADEGCCPASCNALTDPNCSPVCGNGVTEPPETCDGNCPSSCNDNNACTTDVRSGTSGNCNVTCTNTVITACVNGDGCCPSACDNLNDTDCP